MPKLNDDSQPIDFNDFRKADEAVAAHERRIGQGFAIGRILRFQIADGYATYIITEIRPRTVRVEHLALGDGYHARYSVSNRGTVSRSLAERILMVSDAIDHVFKNVSRKPVA